MGPSVKGPGLHRPLLRLHCPLPWHSCCRRDLYPHSVTPGSGSQGGWTSAPALRFHTQCPKRVSSPQSQLSCVSTYRCSFFPILRSDEALGTVPASRPAFVGKRREQEPRHEPTLLRLGRDRRATHITAAAPSTRPRCPVDLARHPHAPGTQRAPGEPATLMGAHSIHPLAPRVGARSSGIVFFRCVWSLNDGPPSG
jgi:hypothetical protein